MSSCSGHQLMSTLKTRFNPCVIEYLKPVKRRTSVAQFTRDYFIIGTYELVDEGTELAKQYTDLSDRNGRVGTLEVLEVDDNNSRVVLVYECPFGGVFDLRLISGDHLGGSSEDTAQEEVLNFRIVVAHANGVVALYSLNREDDNLEVVLLKSLNTQTNMLTTVEVTRLPTSSLKGFTFHAGSEDGQLIRVKCPTMTGEEDPEDEESNVTGKRITDHGHPIWYIRSWSPPLSSTGDNDDDEADHPVLLFVGSEDSKWRVISEESNELLYTNTDASSGVTSFEFLPPPSSSSSSPPKDEIKVLVGSYDEYIRLYRLSYSSKSNPNSKLTIDSVSHLTRIHIEGGGIWRMRAYPSSDDSHQIKVLTAAMYTGVRLLTLDLNKIDKTDSQSEPCTSLWELSVPSSSKDDELRRLIYGLSSSEEDLSTVTFASFYERELYVFKVPKVDID